MCTDRGDTPEINQCTAIQKLLRLVETLHIEKVSVVKTFNAVCSTEGAIHTLYRLNMLPFNHAHRNFLPRTTTLYSIKSQLRLLAQADRQTERQTDHPTFREGDLLIPVKGEGYVLYLAIILPAMSLGEGNTSMLFHNITMILCTIKITLLLVYYWHTTCVCSGLPG